MLDKMTQRSVITFREVEFRPQSAAPELSYTPRGTPPYDVRLGIAPTSSAVAHNPIGKPASAKTRSSSADVSNMESDTDDGIELKAVKANKPKYHENGIVSRFQVVTKTQTVSSGPGLEVSRFV